MNDAESAKELLVVAHSGGWLKAGTVIYPWGLEYEDDVRIANKNDGIAQEEKPMMQAERPELGDLGRDMITGFQGIVVALTDWLHGCRRVTIQPRALHDAKPVDAQTFDEAQIVVVTGRAALATAEGGGPRPEPTRAVAPA